MELFTGERHTLHKNTHQQMQSNRSSSSSLAPTLALLVLKLEVGLAQLFGTHVHVKVRHLLHEAALLAELLHCFMRHAAAILPW